MRTKLDLVQRRMSESNAVRQLVIERCSADLIEASQLISKAFREGNKLLLCGNGGSAADCQHMAAEFVSRLTKEVERPALPAIALTTDTSFLTAFANDCGYDGVFKRQVEALGVKGDVFLGISTSGSSRNVLQAMVVAKERGLRCIALMGEAGLLKDLADVSIAVPSSHTQYIQESHLSIEHLICELVERELFSDAYERKL
jgi:D-sedoheptulose 7-phosphate isomerase